jgi:hypothetical protein
VSVEITSAPDSTRNIVASRSNSIDIIGNVATADSEVAAGLNRTMLATILVVKLAWEMGKTYLIAKEYAATVRAAHTSTRGRSINAAPCSVKPHEVGHSVNTVVPRADTVANAVARIATVDLSFFWSVARLKGLHSAR